VHRRKEESHRGDDNMDGKPEAVLAINILGIVLGCTATANIKKL
jgi:hypothetical protein